MSVGWTLEFTNFFITRHIIIVPGNVKTKSVSFSPLWYIVDLLRRDISYKSQHVKLLTFI